MATAPSASSDLDALALKELLADSSFIQESVSLPERYEPIAAADSAGAILSLVLAALAFRLWKRRPGLPTLALFGLCSTTFLEMASSVLGDVQLITGNSMLWALRLSFALATPVLGFAFLFAWSLGPRPEKRKWVPALVAAIAAAAGAVSFSERGLRAVIVEGGVFLRVYGDLYDAYTGAMAGLMLAPAVFYGWQAVRPTTLARRDALILLGASSGVTLLSVAMAVVLPLLHLAQYLFYSSIALPLALIAPYLVTTRWVRVPHPKGGPLASRPEPR